MRFWLLVVKRMICSLCELAEVQPHQPWFRGLSCCEARHLMTLPAKFRREVAAKLKSVSTPELWQQVRERLDVLMQREAA